MTQRLFQPSLAGGELSPSLYGRVDIKKYAVALRRCRNFLVHRTGGISNRAGFAYLGDVADHAVCPALVPFRFNASADQVCMLEFGDYTMRVWYQGGLVLDEAEQVVVVETPYSAAEAAEMDHAQSGDILYLAHASHPPAKLERSSWTEWAFSTLDFVPRFVLPETENTTWKLVEVRKPNGNLIPSASGGVVTLSTIGSANQPMPVWEDDDVGRTVKIDSYQNSGEVFITAVAADHCSATGMVLGNLSNALEVTVEKWALWEYRSSTSNAWSALRSGGVNSNTELLSYKVTAVSEETGEESMPSDAFYATGPTADDWPVGTKIVLTGPGATEKVAYYRVYKETNGLYGYIGLSGDGAFEDTNITPDISDSPPDAENPFSDEGNFPGKVAFHQQRLCFAATNNAPNGVWMSRTGFYESMSKSTPIKDDDAITFSLGSGEVNAIRGLVSVNELIILTGGSENVCNGGSTGAAVTPSSITVKPQSYWGAGELRPLVSGNTVLFIQGLGSAVRYLGYEYSADGFIGNDLSILARHFMEGAEIRDWAYAQVPDSVFWMVRDDGALLTLTYFKEQDVGAWALHSTEGVFERVAVIEGEGRHDVYVVVARQVNGETRRSVERLASRVVKDNNDAAFLDSHVVYDGRQDGTTTDHLTGLDHLEGCTVGVYADGNVLGDVVVSNGAITLGQDYGRIVVGLRYDQDSVIETLDVDLGMVQGLGTVQARNMIVSAVTLRLQNAREFLAGPDDDNLTLTKSVPDVMGQAPALYSGDEKLTISSAWDSNGRVVIKPNGPVPLTILSIAPDITVGG
jgi:hypothetical protein